VKFSLKDDRKPAALSSVDRPDFFTPEADEYEWVVPATVIPEELQRSLNVIDGFLANPIDLDGRPAADELNKKAKPRKRIRPAIDGDDDEAERKLAKCRERKQREEKQYKSAELIEDSDFDPAEDTEFYKKEKALRERAATAAHLGKPSIMLSSGTKKRKKRQQSNTKVARRRKDSDQEEQSDVPAGGDSDSQPDTPPVPRPEVRPRRHVAQIHVSTEKRNAPSDRKTPLDSSAGENDDDAHAEPAPAIAVQPKPRRRNQVVISDEDE
jgi:replication fork protection complex subunit Tof1/Swi1